MDKDLKARWVAALRSGEFKQGYKTARRDYPDGNTYFCCLGVLATLDPDYESTQATYPPTDWVSDDAFRTCVLWNDRDKLTFPQIADLIERSDM